MAARIQCTPDLQPTDITGLSIWNPQTREFEFRAGPVFANVLLVDEVNRALAEGAVRAARGDGRAAGDGRRRHASSARAVLPDRDREPDRAGGDVPAARGAARPVPAAHLAGYPNADDELRILDDQLHGHPLSRLRPAVGLAELETLFSAVEEVYVDPLLKRWIVDLVRATRELEIVQVGASVRGTLALERVARAWALLHGRPFVAPEDVEELFLPVLGAPPRRRTRADARRRT